MQATISACMDAGSPRAASLHRESLILSIQRPTHSQWREEQQEHRIQLPTASQLSLFTCVLGQGTADARSCLGGNTPRKDAEVHKLKEV